MKPDGKRLERAFTEAPSELRDAVELAFQRGEKAMKVRHKTMVSLSAAAVFVVLVLGIALAAGRLTAPRPDPVVAAQGGGAKASVDPTQDIIDQITPEPTTMPEITPLPDMMPEPTLTAYKQADIYYSGDETCEESMEAENAATQSTVEAQLAAMTAQDAWEKLLEADEQAGKSGEVWVYLSSEADAAWVFYATQHDGDEALRTGAAWFISEKECVCLGRSDGVEGWFFFTQQLQPNPVPPDGDEDFVSVGSYATCGRELFSSRIRKGKTTVAHLWMVGEDGLPIELDTGNGLTSVEAYGGILTGKRNVNDDDWVFLHAHDQLYQVTAQPVGIEEVKALPGAAAILDELQGAGYAVTDCLYRDMDQSGSGAAAITVNLKQDGQPFHAYLTRKSWDDDFIVMRGWEDDINIYPGAGTLNPDAGLPALASSTLETDERVFGESGA